MVASLNWTKLITTLVPLKLDFQGPKTSDCFRSSSDERCNSKKKGGRKRYRGRTEQVSDQDREKGKT